MIRIVVICISFFAGVMATKWLIGRHYIPGVLNYKESREFERKIAEGLRHPVGLVPIARVKKCTQMHPEKILHPNTPQTHPKPGKWLIAPRRSQ